MESKKIVKYCNTDNYCVLIPVYYDHEQRPAWRKYYIGPESYAREYFEAAPDYLKATANENYNNRFFKRQEYLLLLEHGKIKEADEIKTRYGF